MRVDNNVGWEELSYSKIYFKVKYICIKVFLLAKKLQKVFNI